jgi:hypothetical protein
MDILDGMIELRPHMTMWTLGLGILRRLPCVSTPMNGAEMMKPATEHTERYTAIDEEGVEHLIDVYTDMIEVPSFGARRVPGLNSHKMSATGCPVNVESDGTLVVVSTGRKLRRK